MPYRYTVSHVAAQYGQTAFLYHVALRWGADMDSLDTDGRSPLHWAAYKGYGDTIRLLLVTDACLTLADREGCTPLHWAAIRGNGEACTLLLQVLVNPFCHSPSAVLGLGQSHVIRAASAKDQQDKLVKLLGQRGSLSHNTARYEMLCSSNRTLCFHDMGCCTADSTS